MTQDIYCTECNRLLGGLRVYADDTVFTCLADNREFYMMGEPIPVLCPYCGKQNLVY